MGTSIECKRLARDFWAASRDRPRGSASTSSTKLRGTEFAEQPGNWSASAWDPDGHGEHSVEAQRQALEHYVDAGGMALGAFADGRLVGIGAVVPHLRPGSRSSRSCTSPRRSAQRGSAAACPASSSWSPAAPATPRSSSAHAVGEHGALLPGSRLRAHGRASCRSSIEREPEDVHLRKAFEHRPVTNPVSVCSVSRSTDPGSCGDRNTELVAC